MTMKSITPKNLAKVLALILVLWLGWQWSTHYVNWSPYRLSEYIVKNNLRAEECNNLVVFNPPGPLPDEQIRTCIYLVAELTKDPSICELLMPSSYGLSCVGGAMKFAQCKLDTDYSVRWDEDAGVFGTRTLSECQQNDPRRSKKGNACCTILSVRDLVGENDCTSLNQEPVMFDECQYNLAFKNHDPTACASITDPNVKAGCIVSAEALKKDPSICTGCVPPVQNVEDIE